jgi:hypothetical protein
MTRREFIARYFTGQQDLISDDSINVALNAMIHVLEMREA